MSTDPERRLRAALEASAELITDPPDSAGYQPPATNPAGGARPRTRRRRQARWVAPLLAAAAVVGIAAGGTAIVRTVNKHEGTPVSHRSSSPVTSTPSPTPTSAGARQQPLAGPQVIDAGLFTAGRGYVRTQHSLLWTDDLGATWRNITPPGLTQAQLQSAGIALQPDGHEWVAVAPKAGYVGAPPPGAWWTTRDAGQSWTQLQLPTPATKKSDSVSIISAPALAGDAVVLAASFTTPAQGNHDGVGIYRSTNLGATWT